VPASCHAIRATSCALLSAALLSSCGGGGASTGRTRAELRGYLHQIEPLRLAVNRLLDDADPTLTAFREHHISGAQAADRMGNLERRFAAYAVDVNAIEPRVPVLRALHVEYAHTYILEDAYLSALVAGLASHELNHLPDTQAQQRAAIIDWRIGLTVLARRTHTTLPADLQQAGRGEIAPSPQGS
jgi:hypothetical protein